MYKGRLRTETPQQIVDRLGVITPIFVKSSEYRLLFEAHTTEPKSLDPRISQWCLPHAENDMFNEWTLLDIIVKSAAVTVPGFATLLAADLAEHGLSWRMGLDVSRFRGTYHIQIERITLINLVKGTLDI